jgi:hypothetical protein
LKFSHTKTKAESFFKEETSPILDYENAFVAGRFHLFQMNESNE